MSHANLSSDAVPAHPDEATQAQQEAIEQDIKASAPLISELLPLTTLDDDFLGHSVYLEKLQLLKQKYIGIRRLRRDGNCFYRAFGFAYMQYLIANKRLKEASRFKRKCDECKDTLIGLGYTQFTVEDFHEQFTGMIDRFTIEGGTLEELESTFNSQAYSDYYVVFLRLFVSAYMQKNASFYVNFIDEGRTINQFCETEVEPMSRECDNIHVAALALAVGVPIRIENCQQSGELNQFDFPAEPTSGLNNITDCQTTEDKDLSSSTSTAPAVDGGDADSSSADDDQLTFTLPITLLYRPGHYDILYAK